MSTRATDIEYNIVMGDPVKVRKVTYTGYCSSIHSVTNAVEILDYIGEKTDSDDILPFALRLVEVDEVIQIAEDNGEVACGELLSECLNQFEGYNILVCVSRKVEGFYVSDMIQNLKLRAIKDAASSALEIIFKSLKPNLLLSLKSHPKENDETSMNSNNSKEMIDNFKNRKRNQKPMSKVKSTLRLEVEKARILIDPFSENDITNNRLLITNRKVNLSKGKLIKLSHSLVAPGKREK